MEKIEEEGKHEAFFLMPSDDMPSTEGRGALHINTRRNIYEEKGNEEYDMYVYAGIPAFGMRE